ncbi:DNA-directed RNA polymerase subunit beta [Candidatus Roizmanbacteria bacterium RIFOXYB2_FULL_41_10]|uniref:DNA-directed RNA polymerase subunit beta n=1 Tax=Candidatus Roizmanbacteria bacterium RIFOXYA1_FULL_41_12 TaxID=1802082 RepID=A0A1F7KEZ9_9BACT|nr:MAG: DNA-directed RNA polymerase subunit beta [Candidatus Roizmanbacteria bacterium RIFOXYA1_FULL_41_12]OGK68152.1 MAG: DNA-directed RNA polymerase subunit beta [Candidatus Roizmanbacteria bacterium RIFOXYB1_FULL_41_27]OGK68564.1 MAG: DNA-directed RNA polymerase subunit beta [Candidatus Roizmanbacteria bacterium RIFOXYA2_FULL_41_8]OGK69410.1 MAG: DNA-directed RNA polymerase subunit beta [Candidatus Roizmanbacteria bacterium RIFOXYB2_FULL_41_10]OGK71938.1 MAG: DNA-directed RNA polymerase subu
MKKNNSLSTIASETKRLFLNKQARASDFQKLDFLHFQKESYDNFLKHEFETILKEFFPIEDYTKKNWLMYLNQIEFEPPKITEKAAFEKQLTYQFSVYLNLELKNNQTGKTKTQKLYVCDLPQMTSRGTFIINGIERCVIGQIVRAPGVYFTAEQDRSTGITIYNAEIRPYIGAWLDLFIGKTKQVEAKINKRRKFPVTLILKVFGMTKDEILREFSDLKEDLFKDYILSTLEKDRTETAEEAILELYKKIKPGEALVLENARETINNLFFNTRRYSLANVGRYKINKKLGLSTKIEKRNFLLLKEDLIAIVKYLIKVTHEKKGFDNIDHLGNRRVRRVGELLGMYGVRVGMMRVERDTKERMSLIPPTSNVLPSQMLNPKPLIASINTFIKTSQLSTIVDQTNILSELDNLRRLTVGGPGGIQKNRASFSIRDISPSQYGRICPIRSPEGPNIGVVTYLALYAKINEYGFMETPYFKIKPVKQGQKTRMQVTDEIVYFQPDDEEQYYITHSNISKDAHGFILADRVPARHQGEFIEVPVEQIQYIDVSPRQVVGLSACLIPFLQNDDASRALMGTHMQCQAVPLIKGESPLVGTGMEGTVAKGAGRSIVADQDGEVKYVDAEELVVKVKGKEQKFALQKFQRTNKDTSFSQSPNVSNGQSFKKGTILVDGPSTVNGEIAFGQNLNVAYMAYEGLGYEDAIVISERILKEDLLTSVVIEEYKVDVVNTKLGPEEITRDIPNVREEVLASLDKHGIAIIGSRVKGGDILVGKVAPKGEKELTAEERLLKAIFGEKAKDVQDTSLTISYGKSGIVTDVKVLTEKNGAELEPGVLKRVVVKVAELRKIMVGDKLAGRHGNKGVISKIVPVEDMPYLEDGTPIDIIISPLSVISRMNLGQLFETYIGMAANKLNTKVAAPVFDQIAEDTLIKQMQLANLPVDGKFTLYDGKTGRPFENKVMVGYEYILKLAHMAKDKIHARSTGPYSLVSQQPLGGKAQMGGQRFGEMEVWALEAHRAAYALQEMLTIKSDDIKGRNRSFEAIIKGLPIPDPGIPESFKVLMKELNALSLEVETIK